MAAAHPTERLRMGAAHARPKERYAPEAAYNTLMDIYGDATKAARERYVTGD